MRECKPCDVRWSGDEPCWSCGAEGAAFYGPPIMGGGATWRAAHNG